MSNNVILQSLLQGREDVKWFDANLMALKSQYNNKFIAFHNKKVLDSDKSLDNLMTRLNQKGVDISNVFIKFVSKVKAIL